MTLWSHRREQPCPGALCPLQPLPARALHSAGCPGPSQGGLMTRGLSQGLFPGLTHPVAVRATPLQVECSIVRTAFSVSVSPCVDTWLRALCPLSWAHTQPSGRSLCLLEEWHCCSLWLWALHHPMWPHGGALLICPLWWQFEGPEQRFIFHSPGPTRMAECGHCPVLRTQPQNVTVDGRAAAG